MKTKNSFFKSLIALVLCVAMLAGTTYAWFTDVATSKDNVVQTGTLDVTMEWANSYDASTWQDATQGAIFTHQNWEPGYTDVKYIKISNKGDLNLKWRLSLEAEGTVTKLADVIGVYYVNPATGNMTSLDGFTGAGKLTNVLNNTDAFAPTGKLVPQASVIVAIAMHMDEEAGNEYKGLSLCSAGFSVKLVATQDVGESDSFGDQYDNDAEWPEFKMNFEATQSLAGISTTQQNLLEEEVIIRHESGAYAIVPAGTKLAEGATELKFTGKNVNANGNFADPTQSYDIHIAGIAEDNQACITVFLGKILEAGLGETGLKFYHEDVPMTRVNSVNDFARNNQYTYNAETGAVTLYVDNFSVFSAVKATADVWDGTAVATGFASGTGTEADPFIIATAAQLVYFRNQVDAGVTYDDQYVKLDADIDLAGHLFDPIGFGYTYNKDSDTAFMGIFDGGNHTVYNLYQNGWDLDPDKVNYSTYTYSTAGGGLFASIENATIKNLAVSGANIVFECVDIGIVVGYAQGNCHFENIVVTNSTIANYNRATGGVVGEVCYGSYGTDVANGYSHTFKNIVVDSSVVVSSLWGSFDTLCGGVIGGKWGDATVKMENVIVAAELDVFSDVTAAYQWYAYRRCGMLIGHTEQNSPKKALNAAAEFLTCENVTVYYGDWTNYTYYQFANQDSGTGRSYPWVRAEAGLNNGAFSNPRYGVPTHGEVKVTEDPNMESLKTDYTPIIFNQLYGGGQGVYGCNEHEGVTTIHKNAKTIYIKNNIGWENLKLQYWFQNGDDTWTTLIDGITLIEEKGIYRVELPAYAYAFKIVADGENATRDFYVSEVIDGVVYDLNGEHTHEYQWVIDVEPTLDHAGVKHEECAGCPEKRNENTPIAQLVCANHVITKVDAKAATCLEKGNAEYYTCDACGKVYFDAAGESETYVETFELPALGHNLVNGECTGCDVDLNRTITLMNGNIVSATVSGIVGEKIILPNLDGIEGWYTDEGCTKRFTENTFSDNLTLYAKLAAPNTSGTITIKSYFGNGTRSTNSDQPLPLAIQDGGLADILCVQDAGDTWKNRSVTGYVSAPQNEFSEDYLIYYKNTFTRVDDGLDYLIEGCCSFIVLQRGGTGPKFAVVNAWFKDANVLATVQSTITTIQKKHGPIPVIIAGFSGTGTTDSSNATIDSSVCESLTTNAQFFDAFQVKKQSTSQPQENASYYYNYERSHIFVSYQMQYAVECYDGLATRRNTSYPIVAKITIPTCNHNLTLKSATPATCSTVGNKAHYNCSSCGKLYADAYAMIEITEADIRIPALGHSYSDSVVIAPTCESNGYTAQTCSVCGYVHTDNETPALGHAWTNACDTDCNNACGSTRDKVHDYQWVVDKVPTSESVGIKHEECTICQEQRNKNTPIEMLSCGHELTRVEAVAPTCTTAGNREYYTCSVCDRAYTDASGLIETTVTRCTIAAFGHKNNPSGVCTVCGQVKITFQNGSANNTLEIVPAVLGIAGEAMSTLPTPELAGYTFEGWYRDKACTVLFAETIFSESLTLYAKFVPVTTGEEQTLSLVSLNINDGDSTNSFITSLVNSNNKPDIISLQEAGSSWRKLGNNAVFSNYYGAYQNTQGGNVIFINTKTLTYVTSTARWISDTYTDEFGNTYSTNASRYVHYFVVRRLSDDQLFAIINIQLDNDGKNSYEIAEKIRQEEIEFLMRQVEGVWGGQDRGTMPIIITGDFNSTSDGIAYDRMTETYGFYDSSKVANQIISNSATTGDFIFVSSHLQYLIESYEVKENSGSDHNAIILEFTLPKICSHDFRNSKTEAVAATCTTAGNKEYYTCTTCHKVYADIRATVETTVEDCIIPALGHNWADATCESPKTCSNCGTTEGEALGHAWTNSCDTDCNNSCGAIREITHDYQWVVDKAPTVASEGVKHEECTVCQEKQNENTPIDKLLCTHNGTIAKVEAIATTCKAAGNKEYYSCSACQKTYSDANGYLEITEEDYTIPALPHTWVDATCNAPKTCSACGTEEGDKSTEHVINAEGTCTVCNQVQIGIINLYGGPLPYGTYSGDNAKIATAVSGLDGEKITLPNPQLQGHTFGGWYNDYACTDAFKGETFVKGSKLTLYAKWTPNTESIKVMSFNVRTDWYKGSRDERVVATIQDNMPDVLCVQEADSGWMSILNDRLPDLGYTAVYANKWGRDGENSGEHTAIFFRTDKFTAVASGTKWLSNTPDKVSKYSYTDANGTTHTANYNRIMTYVVLERKSDGGCFLIVNTHLDNNGDNAHDVAEVIRQAEVDIMMKIIKGITDSRGDIPVIVTGDFNVIPNNRTAYTAMTSTYGYTDSSQVAKQSEKGEATYNGMGEGTASILDYIFVSRHMKETVTSYNVCDAKRDGEWISDHNAIISVIEMPYVKRTF